MCIIFFKASEIDNELICIGNPFELEYISIIPPVNGANTTNPAAYASIIDTGWPSKKLVGKHKICDLFNKLIFSSPETNPW